MNIIFLLGAIQALFFAVLFSRYSQSKHAHKVLLWFFLINAMLLMDHYLEAENIVFNYPHLLGITYALPIILGPIIYYYTLVITQYQEIKPLSYFSKHAIPFVVVMFYLLFNFYFLSAEEKLAFYRQQTHLQTSWVIYISELLLNFSVPIYSLLAMLCLRKHNDHIVEYFSDLQHLKLRWLKVILLTFIVISVLSLMSNLFSDIIVVMPFSLADDIMYMVLTFAVFFIGYFGIKQQLTYLENNTYKSLVKTTKKSYQKNGLSQENIKSKLPLLLNMMEQEKPYLQPKLSLRTLAQMINMTENQLSQLINEGLDKNFHDFVNTYRIRCIQEKLEMPELQHLSLLSLALESGFNSKSSFNYVFKKHTSMTPSEYKRKKYSH